MKYQVPSIRYQDRIVLHLKFSRPGADQRAKNKESGRAGFSMNKQIKNLQPITYNLQLQKCQNEISLGSESAFPTTNNQQPDSYRVATKRIYDSQIGVREQGINSGRQVEEYLRYVNMKKGQPWCAAFICWVYGKAGIDNPRSGWSPDLFKGGKLIWTKAESRKLKVESREKHQDEISQGSMSVRPTTSNRQPTTADIFGIYFPDKNRIAHAGFIDQWDGTWLITVEGNTNTSDSREGDGVYRKRRLVKSVYQVARYIWEQ